MQLNGYRMEQSDTKNLREGSKWILKAAEQAMQKHSTVMVCYESGWVFLRTIKKPLNG